MLSIYLYCYYTSVNRMVTCSVGHHQWSVDQFQPILLAAQEETPSATTWTPQWGDLACFALAKVMTKIPCRYSPPLPIAPLNGHTWLLPPMSASLDWWSLEQQKSFPQLLPTQQHPALCYWAANQQADGCWAMHLRFLQQRLPRNLKQFIGHGLADQQGWQSPVLLDSIGYTSHGSIFVFMRIDSPIGFTAIS